MDQPDSQNSCTELRTCSIQKCCYIDCLHMHAVVNGITVTFTFSQLDDYSFDKPDNGDFLNPTEIAAKEKRKLNTPCCEQCTCASKESPRSVLKIKSLEDDPSTKMFSRSGSRKRSSFGDGISTPKSSRAVSKSPGLARDDLSSPKSSRTSSRKLSSFKEASSIRKSTRKSSTNRALEQDMMKDSENINSEPERPSDAISSPISLGSRTTYVRRSTRKSYISQVSSIRRSTRKSPMIQTSEQDVMEDSENINSEPEAPSVKSSTRKSSISKTSEQDVMEDSENIHSEPAALEENMMEDENYVSESEASSIRRSTRKTSKSPASSIRRSTRKTSKSPASSIRRSTRKTSKSPAFEQDAMEDSENIYSEPETLEQVVMEDSGNINSEPESSEQYMMEDKNINSEPEEIEQDVIEDSEHKNSEPETSEQVLMEDSENINSEPEAPFVKRPTMKSTMTQTSEQTLMDDSKNINYEPEATCICIKRPNMKNAMTQALEQDMMTDENINSEPETSEQFLMEDSENINSEPETSELVVMEDSENINSVPETSEQIVMEEDSENINSEPEELEQDVMENSENINSEPKSLAEGNDIPISSRYYCIQSTDFENGVTKRDASTSAYLPLCKREILNKQIGKKKEKSKHCPFKRSKKRHTYKVGTDGEEDGDKKMKKTKDKTIQKSRKKEIRQPPKRQPVGHKKVKKTKDKSSNKLKKKETHRPRKCRPMFVPLKSNKETVAKNNDYKVHQIEECGSERDAKEVPSLTVGYLVQHLSEKSTLFSSMEEVCSKPFSEKELFLAANPNPSVLTSSFSSIPSSGIDQSVELLSLIPEPGTMKDSGEKIFKPNLQIASSASTSAQTCLIDYELFKGCASISALSAEEEREY